MLLELPLPPLIAQAGPKVRTRFVEFFAAQIRNPNTRDAYARDIARFCRWAQDRGLRLRQLKPVVIATYIEELGREIAAPSVKRHLAAIRMLCDWFVLGQVLPWNPAASVRGPKHVVKRGKTPILSTAEARRLLDSIDGTTLAGLRDRALIGVLLAASSILFEGGAATTGGSAATACLTAASVRTASTAEVSYLDAADDAASSITTAVAVALDCQ